MSDGLVLISGVVSGLTIHEGEEEFVRSAGQQAVGVGAAAGLAASGMAGATIGASIAATSAGDSVQFFSCAVGEHLVQGRFSKATFKDGDEIEVVAAPVGNGRNSVLAARRLKDRVLWMVPHCSRGVGAHRAFAMRLFFWLLVAAPIYSIALYAVLGVWLQHKQLDLLGRDAFPVLLGCAIGGIIAIYYPIRFYFQWRPIARQAERIFTALAYLNPSQVDLPRDHKRYCKAHGIKWPYLSDGPWIYHYLDPHGKP